jgi:hypothetical protein
MEYYYYLSIPLFVVFSLGVGMIKDYLQIKYLHDNDNNKKFN